MKWVFTIITKEALEKNKNSTARIKPSLKHIGLHFEAETDADLKELENKYPKESKYLDKTVAFTYKSEWRSNFFED
jgi:hypothetical protein